MSDFEGKIKDLKFGHRHNGFIDNDNKLYLWGQNDFG
jgi:hypothetical protein